MKSDKWNQIQSVSKIRRWVAQRINNHRPRGEFSKSEEQIDWFWRWTASVIGREMSDTNQQHAMLPHPQPIRCCDSFEILFLSFIFPWVFFFFFFFFFFFQNSLKFLLFFQPYLPIFFLNVEVYLFINFKVQRIRCFFPGFFGFFPDFSKQI